MAFCFSNAVLWLLFQAPVALASGSGIKETVNEAYGRFRVEGLLSHAQQLMSGIVFSSPSPSSTAQNFAPWTHEPFCLPAKLSGKSKNGQKTQDLEYCVYTNANFRCGRGISIVTTPSVAASIASSAAFSSPDDCGRMTTNAAYEEVQLPGRGTGLIADRTIERSELIMLDSPTFVFNDNAYDDLDDKPRRQLIWRGIEQLPPHTRELTIGMAKSTGGEEMEDVMQTNAFTQFFGRDIKHETVLREAALLNHDCRPNVLYRFDNETLTHYGHALRKINAGEELLHTYIDMELPHEQRQAMLLRFWGFKCACSLCQQDESRLLASDTRLSRVQELKQKIVTPAIAQEMLALYDKEGLIAPKFRVWEAAAYAHNEVGEKEEAIKHAAIVYEFATWLLGPKHPQTSFWADFIKHPEGHISWRARLR